MSRMVNGTPDDAGFTLIEMLVTLVILSCISTIMLGAIVTARQVAHRLIVNQAADSTVAAAQTLLRARLGSLRAIPRLDRATPIVDLQGDDQRISFFAPALARDGPTGLQAFRLMRMATGDLVLFSSPSLSEGLDLRSPSIAGWTSTRLLTGTNGLSISYFGPAAGGPGARWQRFWSDRAQPPELVRVGVNFPAGDRRSWPELVVRPSVTLNMACRFDAVTARCTDGAGQ